MSLDYDRRGDNEELNIRLDVGIPSGHDRELEGSGHDRELEGSGHDRMGDKYELSTMGKFADIEMHSNEEKAHIPHAIRELEMGTLKARCRNRSVEDP